MVRSFYAFGAGVSVGAAVRWLAPHVGFWSSLGAAAALLAAINLVVLLRTSDDG